ncbi:MAG TPA: class I SAM-dependent methyltransferase [Acidimicrobiia bacterium]|jgi:ubiquinone/menaquinone biosynthesis C-methylase UbiE|nr:class I SAM-dependent methyltransferase [Acidimicrobiia bacterium]
MPQPDRPFTTSAEDYDLIYQGLPYDEQAALLTAAVRTRRPDAATLLEVGCGTGQFLLRLRDSFDVEGLDISAPMLDVARRRTPDVPLHEGDMRTFDLGKTFDAVLCLFSSIGYMVTPADLRRALANMARHVADGGVLIVDPWFAPDGMIPGYVGADLERHDKSYVMARLSETTFDDQVSVMNLHHMVGSAEHGVRYYVERHEMGLFSDAEYARLFADLGFDAVRTDDVAWSGRSRWIAVKG